MTDQEREQLLRAVAKMTADMNRMVEHLHASLRPAVEIAVSQFAQLIQIFKDTGLLDENGNPTTEENQ